jgi:uncharacterized protein (UPF0335 family)
MTKEIVQELVEKIASIDNEMKMLQEDRKTLLEDYKYKLDIKAFKAALRIIKLRENVDGGELDNILGVLDNN